MSLLHRKSLIYSIFLYLFSTEFGCKAVADIAFIVDSSGSIGRRNWMRMLQFLKDMVKAFNVGPDKTHIAVVAYSTNAVLEFRFDRLTGSAITEEGYYGLIDRIRFQRGYTFIDKALSLAYDEIFTTASGMRPEVQQVRKLYKCIANLRYCHIFGKLTHSFIVALWFE